jgi:probable phosphoglycerate mutase
VVEPSRDEQAAQAPVMTGAGAPQATRIVAIRHGETAWNAEARMQGHLDIPLNEVGRRQARQLAPALLDEGITAIWSSDLARARETAETLGAAIGVPVRCDSGLRERCFGVFEGELYQDIGVLWPEAHRLWHEREPDAAPPGGESPRVFFERVVATCERIAAAHAGQTVAIVAHGGVLDCLYRAATHVSLQSPRTWELGNASINRLLYTPQGFALVGWGDVNHLAGPARDEANDGRSAGLEDLIFPKGGTA